MSPCQLLRVLRNSQEASLPAPPAALGAAGALRAQSDPSGKQPSHLSWVHTFRGQHGSYGKALSQHPDLTNGEPLGPGNSHGAKTLAGFPTLNSLLPLIQGPPPPHRPAERKAAEPREAASDWESERNQSKKAQITCSWSGRPRPSFQLRGDNEESVETRKVKLNLPWPLLIYSPPKEEVTAASASSTAKTRNHRAWPQLPPGLPHLLLEAGLTCPPAPLPPVPPEPSGQELHTQQVAGNCGCHQAAAGAGGRALASLVCQSTWRRLPWWCSG